MVPFRRSMGNWCTCIAGLAGVAVLMVSATRKQAHCSESADCANDGIASAIPPAEKGNSRPYEHQNSPAGFSDRVKRAIGRITTSEWLMVFFTAVIAGVGAASAVIAHGQQVVMQNQLNQMRDEQRPWIYADVGPGGKILRNQSGGLTFQISFIIHNTGHLPAFYVSPDVEGFLSGEGGVLAGQSVRDRQKRRCDIPLQQPEAQDQIGVTVFPGQTVPMNVGVGITQSQIDDVVKVNKGNGIDLDVLSPMVVGCIRYMLPDGTHHQTGTADLVVMRKAERNDFLFALPLDPTDILPENIIVTPWIEGGTAYAN